MIIKAFLTKNSLYLSELSSVKKKRLKSFGNLFFTLVHGFQGLKPTQSIDNVPSSSHLELLKEKMAVLPYCISLNEFHFLQILHVVLTLLKKSHYCYIQYVGSIYCKMNEEWN
jgi:hypothetical protein